MSTRRFLPRKTIRESKLPEGTITLPDGTVCYPNYGDELDVEAEREAAALRGQREQTTADGPRPVMRQTDRPKKKI